MAEQFGKLTLTPVREKGTVNYAARGEVDFLGEQAMIRVGGAGGPDRTVRSFEFSLPIAG
jgi:hypothetical protein